MINMNTLVFFLLFVVHATVQESLAHGCSKPTFRCQVFTRISELEHSSKAIQDENMELKSLVENQQLEIEKLKKGLFEMFLYFLPRRWPFVYWKPLNGYVDKQ